MTEVLCASVSLSIKWVKHSAVVSLKCVHACKVLRTVPGAEDTHLFISKNLGAQKSWMSPEGHPAKDDGARI